MIYPAAFLFIALWFWISVKDADRGGVVAIAALPFGMFAAADIGGLSLLISHLLAALTLLSVLLRRLTGRAEPISLDTSSILILCFAGYSIFSAVVFVRLFEGAFLVFPMNVDDTGIQISTEFHTTVKPVSPSRSNIAQSGYVLLSALVFVLLAEISRRRGIALLETGLAWAAALNVLLGALSLLGADGILSVVRTADYTLANNQTVLGLPRVIGGYSEASAFGGISSVFFAYFAMSYLVGRRGRDAVLATGNLLATVLAFSSTGFASLFVALFLIFAHSRQYVSNKMSRSFAHLAIVGLSLAVLVVSIAVIATPLLERSASIFDDLFLQKRASESGLERFTWSRYGLNAFVETWGLGAGVGSLRSNGLLSVLLGSVGLIGTVLYLAFLWITCGPGGPTQPRDLHRVFYAARVAALTMTTGHLLSSTTPDPGLLFMVFAAAAAAARAGAWRGAYIVPRAPSSL